MIRLARAATAHIRQNMTIALGQKAVFVVTTVLGMTGLWLAILADTVGHRAGHAERAAPAVVQARHRSLRPSALSAGWHVRWGLTVRVLCRIDPFGRKGLGLASVVPAAIGVDPKCQ